MGSGVTKKKTPKPTIEVKPNETIKIIPSKKFGHYISSIFKSFTSRGTIKSSQCFDGNGSTVEGDSKISSSSSKESTHEYSRYSEKLFVSLTSQDVNIKECLLRISVYGLRGYVLRGDISMEKMKDEIVKYFQKCRSSFNEKREVFKITQYKDTLRYLLMNGYVKVTRDGDDKFGLKFTFPIVNDDGSILSFLKIPYEAEYRLTPQKMDDDSIGDMYRIMEEMAEKNQKLKEENETLSKKKVKEIKPGKEEKGKKRLNKDLGVMNLKQYIEGSFDIPANIVIKILQDWKSETKFCREQEKIDFIISTISNDTLYEIDLKSLLDNEEHEETREWVLDSFVESNSVKKTNSMGFLRAIAKAVILTNKLVEKAKTKKKDVNIEKFIPCNLLKELQEKGKTIEFDIFQFFSGGDKNEKEHPLLCVTIFLFKHYDLFSLFNIDIEKLVKFVSNIEKGYGKNPFHNKYHAADVMLTSHYMLQKSEIIRNKITPIDTMALLFASMIHDYQHTGHTNVFEISTEGKLSMIYNDQSVLENYHLSSAFGLLKNEDMDFLSGLNQTRKKLFRNTVITLVLNTDTAKHFTLLSKFKATILKSFNSKKREDLLNIMSLILKCSDVSNPTKPTNVYFEWVSRIMKEFYNQGDREKAMKMPISPFMSRTTSQSRCQMSFITYLCVPLFETLVTFDQSYLEMLENLVLHLSFFELKCAEEEKDDCYIESVGYNMMERKDLFKKAKEEMENRIMKFTQHLNDNFSLYGGIVKDKKNNEKLSRSLSMPKLGNVLSRNRKRLVSVL